MLLLVALSVVACLVPTVRADGPPSQCGTPKVSSFRASYRSLRNSSGHWTSQVDFKQGQPEGVYEWSADFGQNIITSDGQQSILQTVVYIEAPAQGSSPWVSSPLWYSHVALPFNKPTSMAEATPVDIPAG